MNEDRDIDIESFRLSRMAKIRAKFPDLMSTLFHRGWVETEAEVQTCRLIRHKYPYMVSRSGTASIGGYVVMFTYVVHGKPYDGMVISPAEVQAHDRFAVRYNPRSPGQNNSLMSEAEWLPAFSNVVYLLLILAFLVYLARNYFLHQ
jgi:hypothetical protein